MSNNVSTTNLKYLKTLYKLQKMDCPSEEQMVRMKLEGIPEVVSLSFDLENRTVNIVTNFDENSDNFIADKLTELGFGLEIISCENISKPLDISSDNSKQRKLLWTVLAINFVFFLSEMTIGLIANSLGLVSDSLDMLADSVVYGLALIAVGAALKRKKTITRVAAILQIFLALFGFVETARRFITGEDMPDFRMMIIVSICALIANVICFYLLQKQHSDEIHIKASVIFSLDDVFVNLGVIIAGILVLLTDTRYPDLVAGGIVFAIVTGLSVKLWKMSK